MIAAEIRHRPGSFALAVVAAVVAVALFVVGPTLLASYQADTRARLAEQQAAADKELAAIAAATEAKLAQMQAAADAQLAAREKETIQIMRDLGFNLRIFHKNTNPSRLLAGFESFDMPEEYVERLAKAEALTKVAHLVATLRQMVEIGGEPRLVIGYAPETTQPHVEKKERVMGYQIKPGTVFLGHLAAKKAGGAEGAASYKVGDEIEVLGKRFKVAQVLDEHGTREEDIAILMSLADAQTLLDKPGKISEIVALGCKCKTVERVEEIREQLQAVLPEAQVVELKFAADARDRQRKLMAELHSRAMADYTRDRAELMAAERKRHAALAAGMSAGRGTIERLLTRLTEAVIPLVVLAGAIWIGILAWMNVRERTAEIGLLRAIGRDGWAIGGLLLGRALLVGIAGGIVGLALGALAAWWLAGSVLEIAPDRIAWDASLLALALVGAPLVSLLAAWLPTLVALGQDPAVVLQEA